MFLLLPSGSAAAAACILIVFSICIPAVSSSSRIPLGSRLTVEDGGCWVSPDGTFAFGFFNSSDEADQYVLGIRFNSASIRAEEHAVAWVAGGGVVVGRRSHVDLTEAGELVLFDAYSEVAVWASNTSRGSVSSAQLRDDGNLVLLDGDQAVVWQSFDNPSDTLLPGQKLNPLQSLRAASRRSVSSYYTLSIDAAAGRLKLRWETNVTYWETPAAGYAASAAVFTGDGALRLLDGKLNPVWSCFGDDHGDARVGFRFLRLDVDGNLRMYSWTEDSRSWRPVWQAVQNQCDVFATCSLHGVCFFNSSGMVACKCPFGSAPGVVPTCLAPFKQDCRSGVAMEVLEHTFLYGVYPPEDVSSQVGSKLCSSSCFRDPSCTSATATNDGDGRCLMKRTKFITGYEDPSLAAVSFVKVCLDPIAAALPTNFSMSGGSSSLSSPSGKSSRLLCRPCLIGAALGSFATLCLIQLAAGLYFARRRKKNAAGKASTQLWKNSVGMVSLAPSEIKNLSNNFKHRLGPNTYRGVFPNKKTVIVRDMKGSVEGADAVDDRHFRRWASVLGGIHHKNLVKLEAFSCNAEQRFLVYEFAKHGSVDQWLREPRLSRRLTWAKRKEICTGVARALAYLHSECMEFISHGNLTWRNVVLDEVLEPKVTDYGLWKLVRDSAEAAEDVARFGEMVIMLVSGKQGTLAETLASVHWDWAEGHLEKVMDPTMGGKVDLDEAERAVRVAFWCVQEDDRLRPSMGEVVKVLEGTLPVDPPPAPSPSL